MENFGDQQYLYQKKIWQKNILTYKKTQTFMNLKSLTDQRINSSLAGQGGTCPPPARFSKENASWCFCRHVWRHSCSHMGSFPHPTHYFAAAGENDDFVIAVINFPAKPIFLKNFRLIMWVLKGPDFEFIDKRKLSKIFFKTRVFRLLPRNFEIFQIFFKISVCPHIRN